MPSYRLFTLDPQNGRMPGEWLEASDDDQALKLARELAGGARCEIWLQRRLVGLLARQV